MGSRLGLPVEEMVNPFELHRRMAVCESCRECRPRGDALAGKVSPCHRWLPQRFSPPEQLNLIYHVYPSRKKRAEWQDNLEQLVARWSVFDGAKIVSVVHGGGLVPVEKVARYIPSDARIISPRNDRRFREGVSFRTLLEIVVPYPGATFYAHTKGSSSCPITAALSGPPSTSTTKSRTWPLPACSPLLE